MRLFVGLPIPEAVRNELTPVLKGLERATRPENLHITIKFLGETEKLDWVMDRLQQLQHPAIRVQTTDIGPFKNMVWLKAQGPERLAEAVDALLEPEFPREYRPYQPHITLARAHHDLQQPLTTFWTAEELCLYQVTPGESGSTYTIIARFKLTTI